MALDPPLELKPLLLGPPSLRLAVAESITCGHIQALIGAVPGASDFFLGGITTYVLNAKVNQLNVSRAEAEKANSVSARVAEEMARGACSLFSAEIALATTGYAERSEKWNVVEPFAIWAVAYKTTPSQTVTTSGRIDLTGLTRIAAQKSAASEAIKCLIEFLKHARSR